MADETSTAFTLSGLYTTAWGWSQVMNNPYVGTLYQFYMSPIRDAAGPTDATATALTHYGIPYQVSDVVPPGVLNYDQAYQAGWISSPTGGRVNAGTVADLNGDAAEAFAGREVEASGAQWIADQIFNRPGTNNQMAQIDGIALDNNWWNGTTNINYEVTISDKALPGALPGIIADSESVAVETNLATRMGLIGADGTPLIGTLSTEGGSLLVPTSAVADSNFAYDLGQFVRGAGLGLGALGVGFSAYDQYQAYVADGYQFLSNSAQAGFENGISLFGPPTIGGGVWAAGGSFATGTGVGGAVIGLGLLNLQFWGNLYAKDPQQAVALTYAMGDDIAGAAGVYDPNSPSYVPPNPWQPLSWTPPAWLGDQTTASKIANALYAGDLGYIPDEEASHDVYGSAPTVPYLAETINAEHRPPSLQMLLPVGWLTATKPGCFQLSIGLEYSRMPNCPIRSDQGSVHEARSSGSRPVGGEFPSRSRISPGFVTSCQPAH